MDAVAHGGRRQCLEIGDIRLVHAEDQVEAGKIVRRHLARLLQGNIDTVQRGYGDRTPVRRLARMPAAGARRIDQHVSIQPALHQNGAKDTLRQR